MTIYSGWKIRTIKARTRSDKLKTLDGTVEIMALRGPGAADVNTLACWNAFQAWKGAEAMEYNLIKEAADTLKNDLEASYRKGKLPMAGVRATQVRPIGWILVDFDPVAHNFTAPVNANQRFGPPSPAQIQRVNEAFGRVKAAVRLSRDTMVHLASKQAFGNPMTQEEQIYTDFFGAFDTNRVKKVRDNFQVLHLAFEHGPRLVDLRDTHYGMQTYAACYRKNLRTVDDKGVVSLTGDVNMFLGRAFLGKGDYVNTTDATVGTLVHEFAHGACNAVDVPPVDNAGAWTHARVSDDPADNDFGASTDNFVQASTDADDKLLAQYQPDYAVVNADCYGQFAKQMLIRVGR